MRLSFLCAAALAGLSAPRAAAAPAAVTFEVDARVELVSVVLMLSDPADFKSRRPEGLDPYAAAAEAAFSRFSGHPAVARVAALRKRGVPASALARAVLEPAAGDALPGDLRDFEKAANFAGFFEAHREDYRAFAETARRESQRAISPESALAYMGLPFEGEHRFILAPLLPDDSGAGGLRVRPGAPSRGSIRFRFDAFDGSVAAELARAAVNWVRAPGGDAPAHVAAAVGLRVLAADLGERVYAAELRRRASPSLPRLEAVSERLKEYESERERYPTLQAFNQRLEAFAAIRVEQAARAARGGAREEALTLLAEARGMNPSLEERRLMASLYRELGDLEGASDLLAGLLSAAPRDPGLRVDRADLAARAGDRGAALRALAEAGARKPAPADRRRMALIHQDLKDYAGALTLLEGLAREQPANASLLGDLGLCKYLAGRPDDAIADLRAALKLDSASLPAVLTLGSIHAASGRRDQELAVYDAAPPEGGEPALRAILQRSRQEALARIQAAAP